MKTWITGLFIAAVISGCSTPPTALKAHPEKFTFQVVGVQIPDSALQKHEIDFGGNSNKIYNELESTQLPLISNLEFEKLIQYPDAEITEFPIVYAGLGESVTNDQTEAVSLPVDYSIVDGKPVPQEEVFGLGLFTAVTVNKIDDTAVHFALGTYDRKLKEWQEYETTGGKVRMPFFDMRGLTTTLTLEPNIWILSAGAPCTGITHMLAVRVIPPKTWK